MSATAKTTANYSLPLSWDKYATDRKLIEEAFERIDTAIDSVAGGGGNNADNVQYEDPDGNKISVTTAINDLISRTDYFEIAVNATSGADAAEIIWTYLATRAFKLPANLANTQATAKQSTIPIDLVISVNKNGSSVGAINIAANAVTFTFPAEVLVAIGDEIEFVASSHVKFKSIAITIQAIRLD